MKQQNYISTLNMMGLFASLVYDAVDSQWRGSNRDGKYPKKNLLKTWPAEEPKLLWDFEGLGDRKR